MSTYHYPPSPAFINAEKLQPSPAFRKQVAGVITSIILFLIVYLLLVAASIGLAIICCFIGIKIIVTIPKFITIILGLGLVAVGISVIFFLIKFIFAVAKNENPNRIEIMESDQPELFAFIRRLSEETKTPFPKKIYLSPDVNACVFYNSSFWSMFFPVRKNLEIGLGLVNSINISELKAVIAHEFGHFSQRSMKLGVFTYNVNKIIYNMLYENNSYTSFLNAWGNLHGVLSICAMITVKIAEGIQYILRAMYTLINKNYLALSREMEFHADAVAASAAGGNNVVSGLSRIEVAAGCYNTALNKAGEYLKQQKVIKNMFEGHYTIYNEMASKFKLPVKNGLPEISFAFVDSFSSSRINYKDQWASHPELKERKQHLDLLDMNVAADETTAWNVFKDKDALQESLTVKLYQHVPGSAGMQLIDTNNFNQDYLQEIEQYDLPEDYKGFYDRRYIETADWDFDELTQRNSAYTFEQLFNEANSRLQAFINTCTADIETVKAIKEKKIAVKTFDFDGTKYNREECDTVLEILEKDLAAKQALVKQLDKEAFVFFYAFTTELDVYYRSYKAIEIKYTQLTQVVNNLFEILNPFYQGGLSIEQVNDGISRLKDNHEIQLKKWLQLLVDEEMITTQNNPALHEKIIAFLSKQYAYFHDGSFRNDELNELTNIAVEATDACNDHRFRKYKLLLQQQLDGYYKAAGNTALSA
ncbi:M48 family metalloprotease [Panacibacter sp. DH6]|uniref:M48 family metalloprotease n=1 Tax=Panacibacter microcysteis TaxID=2793269 RepID=A0A931GWZ6_9BACT|nr:M48 family metallopeptidase [Panacibacter microcysteis]MBG9374774.1 M48 family metalloprotease [Panacibacter microcysteis]